MLSLIAALTVQHVIGYQGKMPWHLPADLAWFKRHTLAKPVLMGRNTWHSIGRALPERENLVLSRDPQFKAEGATVVHSIEQALTATSAAELMVIGGAQLYEQLLPAADCLYLTLIDAELCGDTYFPDYSGYAWREREYHERPADKANPYNCRFMILERF